MTEKFKDEFSRAAALEQISAMQANGDFEDAMSLCSELLAVFPIMERALHLMGGLCHLTRNDLRAVKYLEAAIEQDGSNADYYSDLGLCLRSLGRREEALGALEKATILDGDHLGAHYNLAEEYANIGRLDDSLAASLKVIKMRPTITDAWINAAVCLKSKGNLKEAKEFIVEALLQRAKSPLGHFALGEIEFDLGDFKAAKVSFEMALNYGYDQRLCLESLVDSNSALGEWELVKKYLLELKEMGDVQSILFHNLARVEEKLGNVEAAAVIYREAIAFNSEDAVAVCNHVEMMRRNGDYEAALKLALEASEDYAESESIWNCLGNCYRSLGLWVQAAKAYQYGVDLKGDDISLLYSNLGVVLQKQGDWKGARQSFQAAIRLNPENAPAYTNYSICLMRTGQVTEACSMLERSLEIDEENISSILSYGQALADANEFENADGMFRLVVRSDPRLIAGWENLAAMQNYRELPCEDIVNTHKQVAEGISANASLCSVLKHSINVDTRSKRLRIGVLSGDLRKHSVGYFVRPLFEKLNRENFELYCYSTAELEDSISTILKKDVDHWFHVFSLTDEKLVSKIRNDEIDILIELSGFSAGGRPCVLSMRGAPVQLSWLGYPGATELEEIDYRIVDSITDEVAPVASREKLYKLSGCFVCYQRFEDGPSCLGTPALENGFVTFGSFNNSKKISEGCIELWASVLQSVENARLILKSSQLVDSAVRNRITEAMDRRGIAASRLQFMSRVEDTNDHLDAYNSIDIALDTVPYNGTTTTCESLWMGVPVLALKGDRHASRVGASLLNAAGLGDWVANSTEEFVSKAVAFASDLEGLSVQRLERREFIRNSALMDADAFASRFGNALRDIWLQYCSD